MYFILRKIINVWRKKKSKAINLCLYIIKIVFIIYFTKVQYVITSIECISIVLTDEKKLSGTDFFIVYLPLGEIITYK